MVAYSFKEIFAPQVAELTKRQTVRAERQRHARPGEPVQLYTGMRTRFCRKLVATDPICTRIDEIRIVVPEAERGHAFPEDPLEIEINGIRLGYLEVEAFARRDGFGLVAMKDETGVWCGTELVCADRTVSAESLMAAWWGQQHGSGPWRGVVIQWEPRA